MPRVTAADPANRQPGATHGPVRLQGLDRVAAAAGRVSAARWQRRGDEPLVEADRRRSGFGSRTNWPCRSSVLGRGSRGCPRTCRRTATARRPFGLPKPARTAGLRRARRWSRLRPPGRALMTRGGSRRQRSQLFAHQGTQTASHPMPHDRIADLRRNDEPGAWRHLLPGRQQVDDQTPGAGTQTALDHRSEVCCGSQTGVCRQHDAATSGDRAELRPRSRCGPCDDAQTESSDRRGCACADGSRGPWPGGGCSVERCACSR